MHYFVRPRERYLHAERQPVNGTCPSCGAEALAAYRVLSEGGWWEVVKCQGCLHSVHREPGPMYGSFEPLGLAIEE